MILLGVKLIILLLLQEGITTVGLAENLQKQDIGTVNVVLTLMGFLRYNYCAQLFEHTVTFENQKFCMHSLLSTHDLTAYGL